MAIFSNYCLHGKSDKLLYVGVIIITGQNMATIFNQCVFHLVKYINVKLGTIVLEICIKFVILYLDKVA